MPDNSANSPPANAQEARDWLRARRIEEIECLVPDQAGVVRGKIMPTEKFFSSGDLHLPRSIFYQTISGDYPDTSTLKAVDPGDGDMLLKPDYRTLAVVPWANEPTAQIIHDAYLNLQTREPYTIAPRNILRQVLAQYTAQGWQPVIAPEIEFYLVQPNTDPDYPLEPPIGRSGRPETGRQSYSIQAVNEFDDLFEDIYDYADVQGLAIDTLIHEEGAAQMEINLRHGDPLALADQVLLFKRTIREAALKHKIYATFMAKPIANEPGSAMHIHQSVVDLDTGENIFSDKAGKPTPAFYHFIAGQQTYLPQIMCILAPYVNSYRRLARASVAPINVQWGFDNRTTGLRIPNATSQARRIENRIPSSDANPYLAIAGSLAAGLCGLREAQTPSEPMTGNARSTDYELPRGLLEAVEIFEQCEPIKTLLGPAFVETFSAIKRAEFETFMRVISPWEREYLLLNV